MKTKDLITGALYVLDTDVQNPEPDRRSRDWFSQPTWRAGTRFRVLIVDAMAQAHDVKCDVELARVPGGQRISPVRGNAKYHAVRAELVPCEETVETLTHQLESFSRPCMYLLALLVRDGTIDHGQVCEAVQRLEAMDEHEWDALMGVQS